MTTRGEGRSSQHMYVVQNRPKGELDISLAISIYLSILQSPWFYRSVTPLPLTTMGYIEQSPQLLTQRPEPKKTTKKKRRTPKAPNPPPPPKTTKHHVRFSLGTKKIKNGWVGPCHLFSVYIYITFLQRPKIKKKKKKPG